MFEQLTLWDSSSVISSQASAGGASPFVWRDGPTTAPCGPALAPASRSAAPGLDSAPQTSVTSGQSSPASSASAALQSSLESRLRARLDGRGSPLYALTWKEWDMESGPPICALRARGLRTSDSDSGGEGCEPNADALKSVMDGAAGTRNMTATRSPAAKMQVGNGMTLTDAASYAGWPTPSAHGSQGESSPDLERVGEKWVNRVTGRVLQTNLATDAKLLAGWPTPCQLDGPNGGPGQGADRLPGAAALAGWTTPCSRDYRHPNAKPFSERGGGTKGEQLNNQVTHQLANPCPARWTSDGTLLTGSFAQMANGGQLNPEHSRWLMGYPAGWGSCAATVTRSSRKSLRSGSGPSST